MVDGHTVSFGKLSGPPTDTKIVNANALADMPEGLSKVSADDWPICVLNRFRATIMNSATKKMCRSYLNTDTNEWILASTGNPAAGEELECRMTCYRWL